MTSRLDQIKARVAAARIILPQEYLEDCGTEETEFLITVLEDIPWLIEELEKAQAALAKVDALAKQGMELLK